MYQDILSDRQKLVLKMVIEEYVETGEPVGSKVLTDKPYLGFSSATLRNDMAYLESLGLLEKTHTSSGRVPSEEGYRYYVNHLVTRDYDVVSEFPLIDKIFLNKNSSREEMIKDAVDLLSNLTNYMTIASENHFEKAKIAKLDLVQISNNEALLLIVTTTAKVETRRVKIPQMGFDQFSKIIKAFDKALANHYIKDCKYILKSEGVSEIIKQYIDYQDEIIETFEKAFEGFEEFETIRSGLDGIFDIPEFQDVSRIRQIVKNVDEDMLQDVIKNHSNGLEVRIGNETNFKGMEDCSIISIPYQVNEEDGGMIAVIGPKRMEYKRVIPLLEYIAKNMSKFFKE